MDFWIFYILLVISLYSYYLHQKSKWLLEARTFILNEVHSYAQKLSKKNIEHMENEHKEIYDEYKEDIDETTKAFIISSLKIKGFYSILFNPLRNNILSNVKNKGLLLKILQENGYIKIVD